MKSSTHYHDLYRKIEEVVFPEHWYGQIYVWEKYHNMYDTAMSDLLEWFISLPEDQRDEDEFARRLKAREESFFKAEYEAYWRSRKPQKSGLVPIR